MKAILPENTNTEYNPNRKQKRKMLQSLNRKAKRPITKNEFEQFLMIQRLRHGDVRDNDIRQMAMNNVAHYDNPDKFPNGIEVKLNYAEISQRKREDFREEYWQWVEEHKDDVFHLDREENASSLVCLAEDERYREMDGERVRIPRWEFDLFADLLVKNEAGEFVSPWDIPDSTGDFVDSTVANEVLAERERERSAEAEKEETAVQNDVGTGEELV